MVSLRRQSSSLSQIGNNKNDNNNNNAPAAVSATDQLKYAKHQAIKNLSLASIGKDNKTGSNSESLTVAKNYSALQSDFVNYQDNFIRTSFDMKRLKQQTRDIEKIELGFFLKQSKQRLKKIRSGKQLFSVIDLQ